MLRRRIAALNRIQTGVRWSHDFGALLTTLSVLFLQTSSLSAGDWPQILGPARNGVAVGEQLLKDWGTAGPEQKWKVEVGQGFAGVAVAGERVIAFFRIGREEIVRCLNAADGEVVWEARSPCGYSGGVFSDTGPRCVPVVSGNSVVTFGVEGRLQCLQLSSGRLLWSRDTDEDFSPLEGYFGAGSTPVVDGDRVIVNVGGRDDSSVVAFSLKTGRTLWSVFRDHASYSAPIVVDNQGSRLAIVVTRLHLTGIDVATGELRFAIPFGARGPTVNAATPLLTAGRVFVSSSYQIGSRLIDLSAPEADRGDRDEMLLATQYATPVASGERDDLVFAIDGRQDSGSGQASLKCLDLRTWKVLWEEPGLDYGTLIRVNDELLVLTCGGDLLRCDASATGYRLRSRHRIQAATDRGYRLPALSAGRLYVRDDDFLRCLQVGIAGAQAGGRVN